MRRRKENDTEIDNHSTFSIHFIDKKKNPKRKLNTKSGSANNHWMRFVFIFFVSSWIIHSVLLNFDLIK